MGKNRNAYLDMTIILGTILTLISFLGKSNKYVIPDSPGFTSFSIASGFYERILTLQLKKKKSDINSPLMLNISSSPSISLHHIKNSTYWTHPKKQNSSVDSMVDKHRRIPPFDHFCSRVHGL